ncbi:metallo-beta-lactamase superfamily enzyme [Actinobacteria bacterium IMCC26256]|nr:metallo-beta-lactamase superfamily enzyme [Actinobacteria bacterium IMCC26256]
MNIQEQVDQLIDTRPGRELLTPTYDDPAYPIVEGLIYRSGGTTAAYMILTESGRVIVNTGMGYEAPHHKRVFDAIRSGPTHHIITTQAHVDHVGGVDLFKEERTTYIAQANNPACQLDDKRIQDLRMRTAGVWFDMLGTDAKRIYKQNPGVSMAQSAPMPDVLFDVSHSLEVDGLRIELYAAVGETTDCCVVWLPEHRIALVSNLFGPLFPHFPNVNTIRGDRYRFVDPQLATNRMVRALRPEVLITGRHESIVGADLIEASLERLHDAVTYVHDQTLEGINAGTDIWTLMREIELPPELRVGQGYGKVSWAVRTFWEEYVGWFKLRSTTELYPDSAESALAELIDAAGVDAALAKAEEALARGDAPLAIRIGEAIAVGLPDDPRLRALMADAHRYLLNNGGDESFWEEGWLRTELARWESQAND